MGTVLCVVRFHEFPYPRGAVVHDVRRVVGDSVKSSDGAVLSALLTKKNLSWQHLSAQMLQEFASHASSSPLKILRGNMSL